MSYTRNGRTWTAEQATIARRVSALRQGTYYDILGVQAQASITEIRRAFQSLALQLHPDKNSAPGAEEAFKLIAEAWEVLRDASSRAAYDAAGFDTFQGAFASTSQSGNASNWTPHPPRPPPRAPSPPQAPQSRKKRRNRKYKEKLDRQRAEQEAARAARRAEWQGRSAQDVLNRLAQMGAQLFYCPRCNTIHVLFEGDRLDQIHPGASFQTFQQTHRQSSSTTSGRTDLSKSWMAGMMVAACLFILYRFFL